VQPHRQGRAIRRWATAIAAGAALAGCATAPAPPPAGGGGTAPPATPLPRSSIAAVIQHRAELGLTDDQVRDLELIDQKREAADAAVRDELAKQEQVAHPSAAGSNPAGGSSGGGSGTAPGPGPGSGMGGGMRGGGMHGRGMPRPTGPSRADREAAAQQRLDDDDTKAFLDAEEVLTPAQREQAREIASDYRAQLYDRRHGASGH
jgi:hypothetical protein